MPETIQITEIVWMLAAIPGLVLWGINFRHALLAKFVTVRAGISNGRVMWANFSVFLTLTFFIVEMGFIVIGLVAMTTEPSPTSSMAARWIITAMFVIASAAIAMIGFAWKKVDDAFERMAHK